jgi:cytochrome c553
MKMQRALIVAAAVALLGVSAAANAAGDAAAGATKAKACAGCHGANGEGVKPNPKLAGKSAEDIVEALKDFKSGKRANPIMKSLATPLTDADMANLGAFYASKK